VGEEVKGMSVERWAEVVHLGRDEYDIRIDRRGPWGNPFIIGTHGDREQVIDLFEDFIRTSSAPQAVWMRAHLGALKGKRLGCHCAPRACHGDVLALLAELD
jgi:hypothetical protein